MAGTSDNDPQSPLPVPLARLRFVAQEELARRVKPIKTLTEAPESVYTLVKDEETGEHFLHYAYLHVNVAAGAAEEHYHSLLPLEHDEVISFALGEPPYAYPHQWHNAYLRNGPEGGFVWFDPRSYADGASHETEEAHAAYIREKLLAFRQAGNFDEEEIRKLLAEMDQRLGRIDKQE